MTDRTDHRAAAERMLADANEWAAQAGELSPKASERACLAYAQVHALLAIHDTLTDLKPEPATYPWPMTGLTHTRGAQWDAADRYAANEAKQREAGFPPVFHGPGERLLAARPAPLAFAPEATQDATGDDLSASEGESGDEERGEAEEAAEPLLCECGHPINWHRFDDSDEVAECAAPRCPCDLRPSDIARALIRRAVEQAGGGRG